MKPPKPFKIPKHEGYSVCIACCNWMYNMIFHHENRLWNLCRFDYADYWENTDELLPDYRGY